MVQKCHRLLLFSEGQRIKKKPSAFALISLPVPINFVARRFLRRCPSFFTPLPVIFYAVARGFSRRRPCFFHPTPPLKLKT